MIATALSTLLAPILNGLADRDAHENLTWIVPAMSVTILLATFWWAAASYRRHSRAREAAMEARLIIQAELVRPRPTPGVEIEEPVTETGGECRICRAALLGVIVRCRRCGTPHHGDCWDYTGACSTFG